MLGTSSVEATVTNGPFFPPTQLAGQVDLKGSYNNLFDGGFFKLIIDTTPTPVMFGHVAISNVRCDRDGESVFALVFANALTGPGNTQFDVVALVSSNLVNDCIRIGLENNVSTRKKLSILAYRQLVRHDIISYYKLCAISHAAGILANRKKSMQRGRVPRSPCARRPFLVSCYGFKVVDGILKVPLGSGQHFDIALKEHCRRILSDNSLQVRSFTLTLNSLSICYSKEIQPIEIHSLVGIDRNLRNLTVGNSETVVQYDLSKAVNIAENTWSILRSFKRNDVRVRRKLFRKCCARRKNRVAQLLHHVSKAVVQRAKQEKNAIVFEDIRRIRQLYQRGNYRGRAYRGRMYSWSFAEIKRLITYKAEWEGVPIIQLSVKETIGTSQLCPRCGKRITQVDRKTRQMWCADCKIWMDRDVVGAMNLFVRGRAFLAKSEDVFERPQGLAGEAMKGNHVFAKEPVILRVDAGKISHRLSR